MDEGKTKNTEVELCYDGREEKLDRVLFEPLNGSTTIHYKFVRNAEPIVQKLMESEDYEAFCMFHSAFDDLEYEFEKHKKRILGGDIQADLLLQEAENLLGIMSDWLHDFTTLAYEYQNQKMLKQYENWQDKQLKKQKGSVMENE
ncbi:MAG: hypothetical protein COV47_05860 [Candidatus Diapherotrites archaeon CG11_big_fil_rev_8_21_14_0_20_37_9]|nr:MAG: hypothetical protein COV47_05860 [Candidatus Diapherotrites archaeon CG11_big_fil_rev_8_21_14_0_20_37_9]